MPPRYLRKRYPTKLKPCSEFTVEACDTQPAAGCCGVLPCKLCLELDDGYVTISGTATFGGESWSGSVGDVTFLSFWERNSYGVCEYVVLANGIEVYRENCGGGASCRDPAGEVSVTGGTLRWAKHEPRPLSLITDPVTGCRTYYCGTCRCSCECLCVTITEEGSSPETGEICDITETDCDPPIWEGTVGYHTLTVVLGRDDYGNCVVTVTYDGLEQAPAIVTGCKTMSVTLSLEAVTIELRCKICSCDEDIPCIGCCLPIEEDPSPYDVLMAPIPWEVVAPSCPSISGVTGVFTPIDPTAPGIGSCGYCQTYCVYEETAITIPAFLKVPFDPPVNCLNSPCSHGQLRMVLECKSDASVDCCGRLRLWVGLTVSGGTLVGDTGEVPPGECGGSATSWVQLSPSSCTCEGGLSAEFSLSGLEIDCDELWVGGSCDGLPKCCQLNCDLSDAKVVI